jgi:hypothetical protein
MTPYPGPRSVIVLDNGRIHHGPELLRKVYEKGPCARVNYRSPL